MDSSHCNGCTYNFYNLKPLGEQRECPNLSSAKLIPLRKVHVEDPPPWTDPVSELPDCYCQHGYIFLDPDKNMEKVEAFANQKQVSQSLIDKQIRLGN